MASAKSGKTGVGMLKFDNLGNFIPGLLVVGAFVVMLIALFQRNWSILTYTYSGETKEEKYGPFGYCNSDKVCKGSSDPLTAQNQSSISVSRNRIVRLFMIIGTVCVGLGVLATMGRPILGSYARDLGMMPGFLLSVGGFCGLIALVFWSMNTVTPSPATGATDAKQTFGVGFTLQLIAVVVLAMSSMGSL